MTKYAFWPMLLNPPDDPYGRQESEYGPINAETDSAGQVEGATIEEAEAKLPEPPTGCYWGLVGINV